MPHFIVEYTDNIKADARIPELLTKGIKALTDEGYPLLGMRARGLAIDEYVLADGRDCAMVHVVLKVAPGHSDEKKKRTCAVVFELLKAHFADTFERRYLLLSVELVEITAGDGPTLKANNLDRVLARPAGSGVT